MMAQSHRIEIVPSTPAHAEQMERLYRRVYNDYDADAVDVLTAAMFRRHQAVFPQGQFVALDRALPEDEQVIGLTASMRIAFDLAHPHMEPWHVTTGSGWLTPHDPCGAWLYGVESCVLADYRGQGVGGKLIDARFDVVRRLNLRGMVAGSALMGYHHVADSVTIEDYVRGVVAGTYFDVNLSKQLRKGFRYTGVLIPGYVVDAEARGWGAIIAWENPAYDPLRAPLPDAAGAAPPAAYSVLVQPHPTVGQGF